MDVQLPSSSRKSQPERRRRPRLSLAYPVKLWCVETGRFLAGATEDLSAEGALIRVQHPSLLVPGQRLRVGIAWSGRDALIMQRQMLPAIVVRSLGHGETQHVAVSFDTALSLSTSRAKSA